MVRIERLAKKYDIPEDDVAALVDAALAQFEAMVSDYLRGDTAHADTATDLMGVIAANALDRALPRDVSRERGRNMLREVILPRLEEVEKGESDLDPAEVVGRLADEEFPIERREGTNEPETLDEMRDEIEERMRPPMFPSIGCEIVLAITPARLYDIAERLEPAIPPEWELVSMFHRELDNGRELFFHRVETYNDRVAVPQLLEFGEQYAEIDEQLQIEQAKQDAPEEWEQAVESLGRERAIEMFAGLGGSGANLVQLRSVTEENLTGAKSEVLLRVDLGRAMEEDEARSLIAREFMGSLVRVERVGDSEYLLGGELVGNVEQVRETLAVLGDVRGLDVDRENSAVVCRTIEAPENPATAK